jgi:hypothetical protein
MYEAAVRNLRSGQAMVSTISAHAMPCKSSGRRCSLGGSSDGAGGRSSGLRQQSPVPPILAELEYTGALPKKNVAKTCPCSMRPRMTRMRTVSPTPQTHPFRITKLHAGSTRFRNNSSLAKNFYLRKKEYGVETSLSLFFEEGRYGQSSPNARRGAMDAKLRDDRKHARTVKPCGPVPSTVGQARGRYQTRYRLQRLKRIHCSNPRRPQAVHARESLKHTFHEHTLVAPGR